ncbi:hypothetical protein BVX93_01325 [bacterium B13(2017)]|nr:hypothetical protein BVX93_01325 [bacterium B13(2017)]
MIQENLLSGLTYDSLPTNPTQVQVNGTPASTGLSYIYLRTVDEDGDPAWRTYTILIVGEPTYF